MGPKQKKSLLSWEEFDEDEGNLKNSAVGSSRSKLNYSMKDDTILTLIAGAKFKKRVSNTISKSMRKQSSLQEDSVEKSELENEIVVKESSGSKHFVRKFVGKRVEALDPSIQTTNSSGGMDKSNQESHETSQHVSMEIMKDPETMISATREVPGDQNLQYISVNLSDSDDSPADDKIETYDLDMDEGLGFEDDILPLDERSKVLQDLKTKVDMSRAIEAYSSSDEDENKWSHSQIRKTGNKISSLGKIQSLDKVVAKYTNVLSESKANVEHLETQKQRLLNERDLILEKQIDLKASIESSAQKLAEYTRQLEKRREAMISGPTVATPTDHSGA